LSESIYDTAWALRTAMRLGGDRREEQMLKQLVSPAIFLCNEHDCGGTVPCSKCKESVV
jgi:hypothetical protein